MCIKVREFVRKFDALSQPVRLSYKQDHEFTTGVGGFATIVVIFLILIYLIPNILQIFLDPQYSLS